MPFPASDQLHIQGLELECIVGVRPHERKRAQRVRLDITLGLDLRKPARSGRITQTVDYARAADEIVTLLRFRAYRLIEMATEELSAMLFAAHPTLSAVQIHLEKPEALRGRAVTAAVTTARQRGDYVTSFSEVTPGVSLERWLETHEATLELIALEPGARFTRGSERRVIWLTRGSLLDLPANVESGQPLHEEVALCAGPEGASLFSCRTR